MLFADVRILLFLGLALACCGKAAYEKNKAPNRKHITHQCAAISHTWCKNATRPWQNLVLPRPLFPCPICAQRRPRITKSSGSCSRAQTVKIKFTPRAASCLLMGSRPQWPPFGAKPRNCKYSYGGSPGFPPGSFYPPPPRSAAAKGRMIRCSSIYIILISYSCTPVNILFRKRGPPPAVSAGGGWVRVWARTRLERK